MEVASHGELRILSGPITHKKPTPNIMDLKEIQNLIKFVAKSGASEVKLETGDVKITIKTGSSEDRETTIVQQVPMGAPQMPQMQAAQPQQAAAPQQEATATEESKDSAADDSKYITVKSPIFAIISGEAPMNLILCSSQIFENFAFSDKNPYPG